MTRAMPDCPHCDSADTLEPLRSEGRGVLVCECSACSKQCRVNADGEIVHVPDRRDVLGHVMDDGD